MFPYRISNAPVLVCLKTALIIIDFHGINSKYCTAFPLATGNGETQRKMLLTEVPEFEYQRFCFLITWRCRWKVIGEDAVSVFPSRPTIFAIRVCVPLATLLTV